MNSSLVFKVSLLIFLLALLYLLVMEYVLDLDKEELEYKVYPLFKRIMFAGGVVLLLSLFLRLLEAVGILKSGTKCVRCGAKIPPGHLYCEKHKLEAAKEFRERNG